MNMRVALSYIGDILEEHNVKLVATVRRKHLKCRLRYGDKVRNIILPITPSDHRAMLNVRTKCKRICLELRGETNGSN